MPYVGRARDIRERSCVPRQALPREGGKERPALQVRLKEGSLSRADRWDSRAPAHAPSRDSGRK